MTAFKLCTKKGADDISQVIMRVTIPKLQMNIIKSSVVAFMPNSSNDVFATEGFLILFLVEMFCL